MDNQLPRIINLGQRAAPPTLYPTSAADEYKQHRLLLTAGTSTQFVHLRLDKLTIVGEPLNKVRFIKLLERHPDIVKQNMSKYPYRYNYQTTSKMIVQQADQQAPVPEIRIEYNPSNLMMHDLAHSLLRQMKHKRPTRIDWAMDYPLDLSQWQFLTNTAKKGCVYSSENGTRETIYLGASDSSSKYRIYNKALEQKTTGTLWRIEQQMRIKPATDWSTLRPFADLHVVKYSPNLTLADRAMLDYLHRNPESWSELSRRHLSKYRSLLRDWSQVECLNPWPSDEYHEQCEPLRDYLTAIFSESTDQTFSPFTTSGVWKYATSKQATL